ncbi:MAG: hypothetical protein SWX82_32425 [Cyanobacteriota bacterium]|nr:hypothetical protein [Cyanobacteriota bacterium]
MLIVDNFYNYFNTLISPTPPLPCSCTPVRGNAIRPYSPAPLLLYSCTGECHSPLLPCSQLYNN